jgi:hypothetical protein
MSIVSALRNFASMAKDALAYDREPVLLFASTNSNPGFPILVTAHYLFDNLFQSSQLGPN